MKNKDLGDSVNPAGLSRPELLRVLESAARFQEAVPDAVLAGGSAAALWADHPSSFEHDHVLEDLAARFDSVLEAIEATDGWVTNRAAPGKIILGELGDIESGVRQLMRKVPLEVMEVVLPSGQKVRAPTPDEILRIKGYLIVRRNQVRDYLDVAALSDRYGISHAADALGHIDDYYSDQRDAEAEGVATQLARQLAAPQPADARMITQLGRYKGLDARWADWKNVTDVCRSVAVEMVMTTALRFRNLAASSDDPVETWPFEEILAAVERGTLPDWRRLAKVIRADPWGPVAQQVLEAVHLARPYGTAQLLEGVVERARKRAADSERAEVAAEVRRLVSESGLSQREFAARIGTSRSRLSTYASGKVTPSATLLVRMGRVARSCPGTPQSAPRRQA